MVRAAVFSCMCGCSNSALADPEKRQNPDDPVASAGVPGDALGAGSHWQLAKCAAYMLLMLLRDPPLMQGDPTLADPRDA